MRCWVARSSHGTTRSGLAEAMARANDGNGRRAEEVWISPTALVLRSGWPEGQIAPTVHPAFTKAMASRAGENESVVVATRTVGFTLVRASLGSGRLGRWLSIYALKFPVPINRVKHESRIFISKSKRGPTGVAIAAGEGRLSILGRLSGVCAARGRANSRKRFRVREQHTVDKDLAGTLERKKQ